MSTPKPISIQSTPPAIASDWQTVSFSLSEVGEAPPATIHYRVPAGLALNAGDCAVAFSLFAAMKHGQDLDSAPPLSARLASALPTIQDIWVQWKPGRRRVGVTAPPAPASGPAPTGVACFFTGGVDSFYTLLKHLDTIDTLIYVHGFDLLPDGHPSGAASPALRERVSEMMREVARHYGKRLIEVHTDLRLFTDAHDTWLSAHGPALASVGLLLSPQFKTIYIASSNAYGHLVPSGTHPLLDPLWSTETLQFVHDGCEATRTDKLAVLAQTPFAFDRLRVCWENRDGAYNCGRCNKCLRTMVNLRLIGYSAAVHSFETPLDWGVLARVRFDQPRDRKYALWSLEAAEAQGDRELARALRRSLRYNDRRDAFEALWSPLRRRLRGWPLLRDALRAWRR